MSYTITKIADDKPLEIYAKIRDTDEWNKFCQALAKYRDQFEPKHKEEKK